MLSQKKTSPKTTQAKSCESRKKMLEKKQEEIRKEFNRLYSLRIEGLKPDYDQVIKTLVDKFYLSSASIKKILKT